MSGLLLVAPPIAGVVVRREGDRVARGAVGLEGAPLVLHVEGRVLQLEGRARSEDQSRVERHRLALPLVTPLLLPAGA